MEIRLLGDVMKKQRRVEDFGCPVETALDVVGGKWKAVILYHLKEAKVVRFGELKRFMPDVTQQMLTNQLRELEADGIIHREVYRQVPPKVEYSLTELGRSLRPILDELCKWGVMYEQRLGGRKSEPWKTAKARTAG